MGLSCSRRDLDLAGMKSSPVLKEDAQGSLKNGLYKDHLEGAGEEEMICLGPSF